MRIIAVNTLHDSTISVYDSGSLHNYELERLTRARYLNLSSRADVAEILGRALAMLESLHGSGQPFDLCVYHGRRRHHALVKNLIRAKSHEKTDHHHRAHAAAALYESPFQEALIVSFDGGGFDGVFNIYTGRRGAELRLEQSLPYNLGTSYRLFAYPISEVRKSRRPRLTTGVDLSAAGKLMGLAAYGKPRAEWLPKITGIMKNYGAKGQSKRPVELLGQAALPARFNQLSGQDAYDLAATAQRAFEDVFFEAIAPYFKTTLLPICLTGGAALNVLLNERIRRAVGREVFVPPNPNDSGITTGLILDILKPKKPFSVTYSGWPLLSANGELPGRCADLRHIAQLLAAGKLIGVARGRSEHGPRALGNRSILCDPGVVGMKDILNHKVKFREWYRPFAPVTRLENVGKYFEIDQPAPYMSFAPRVREQWKSKLASIVHADGTARVQTVTEPENLWLHQLLGEFEKLSGYDVLLNTSFNIKGLPILTTAEDALDVLKNTRLDAVLLENNLISKSEI